MKFRQIDAQAIWKGERAALHTFRKAFYDDCEGDGDLFLRVYGWKQEALTKAISDCADSERRPA